MSIWLVYICFVRDFLAHYVSTFFKLCAITILEDPLEESQAFKVRAWNYFCCVQTSFLARVHPQNRLWPG